MVWQLNTVDVRLYDTGKSSDHLRYLCGADILSLPSERIAETVQEEPPAIVSPSQRISRAVPQVTLLEDVTNELLLRGIWVVVVALERLLVGHGHEHFSANIVWLPDGESGLRVAYEVSRACITTNWDECVLKQTAAQNPMVSNGCREVITSAVVDEGKDSLRGVKKLHDLRDAKAVTELDPDIRSEAVAVHSSNFVLEIKWRGGCSQEVSCGFSNIGDPCRTRVAHLNPEVACAEFFANAERYPIAKHVKSRAAASTVVKWHAVVPAV